MLTGQLQKQSKIEQFDESKLKESLKDVSKRLMISFDVIAFVKKHVDFVRSDSTIMPTGFLAEVHGSRIRIDAAILDLMFGEMKQASESENAAYTGLALRMALVLTHERNHILEKESQMNDLGFTWPSSSLHSEISGVTEEAKLYGVIAKHKALLDTYYLTSPPRNYIIPGMSASITQEFDRRIQGAHSLLENPDPQQFKIFVQHYYPNAVVISEDNRKDLELQLTALRKVITDPEERTQLEEAISICANPEKYKKLFFWYQSRYQLNQ